MTSPMPSSANDFIEQQLNNSIIAIEKHFDADCISFSGPLIGGVDDIVRIAIEDKKKSQKKKLIFILTTNGGYIEIVQRIVDILRHHYEIVDFIVPNYGYSAGTVLVMSGDDIYMDYYSRLGPIDPQVENLSGKTVPALGYLERYERLIKKANDGTICMPEVQLLISGFDQAELYKYEQARELSIALLTEWLVKYKFKNWKKTETRNKKVTKRMKTQRAVLIAKNLNKTEKWHTHGYGISMEILKRDLKLKIIDFGGIPKLDEKIRGYYELFNDYMNKLSFRGVIHTTHVFRPFYMGEG